MVAKGEYSDAYRRMCTKKDEMDRRELLRKEAEKAKKLDGIERPHNNSKRHKEEDETHARMVEEYEHIRGEYEAQLADKIRIDRDFVDHDSNLTLIEVSATFDMLRLNLPVYVLPDLTVNIIDTIASISYCFVCKRNDICNYSHKDGLCKECFYDKYENKCMGCN